MSDIVNSKDWHSILKLLLLTMLSDGRDFERDADSFVDASFKLRSDMRVRGIQTRQTMLDWYIRHRKQLTAIHTGKGFETVLHDLIDGLSKIPNKKPIVHALKDLTKREIVASQDSAAIYLRSRKRWT